MLAAELRGKIARPFACPECGAETAPEALLAIEDALTSSFFGVLQYLPAQHGIGRFLRLVGVADAAVACNFDVEFWPFSTVSCASPGTAESRNHGVEPDVVLLSNELVATVEVKLGSKLGTDPLQLPKEVLHTISRAGDRDWLLVCVTADAREPLLPSFVAKTGMIELGTPMPVAQAVASYFEALRTIVGDPAVPDPGHVAARVRFVAWRDVAASLEEALGGDLPSAVRRAYCDLIGTLGRRGLVRRRFGGFRLTERMRPCPSFAAWTVPPTDLWERFRGVRRPGEFGGFLTRPALREPWGSLLTMTRPGEFCFVLDDGRTETQR